MIFCNATRHWVNIIRIFANRGKGDDKKSDYGQTETDGQVCQSIGTPVRVAILQMLSKQACCYHGDMSEILPVAKSTLSQHLNELKDAGLIQGEVTPPMVKYCINKDNWAKARQCLNDLFE